MLKVFSYFNLDARTVISVESPHSTAASATSSYSWGLGRAWPDCFRALPIWIIGLLLKYKPPKILTPQKSQYPSLTLMNSYTSAAVRTKQVED